MSTASVVKVEARRGSSAYTVLGVRINAVLMSEAVDQLIEWIEARVRGRYVAVTGMHGISEARRDPEFRKIVNAAGLVVPDGAPLVWLARWHAIPLPARVTGTELMENFCQRTGSAYRHFLYGGVPGVAEVLARTLAQKYGITVAATYTPPFRPLTDVEEKEVAALVAESRPDILWVGLSTPKQERWMSDHRDTLNVPVMLGVGAAFDMCSGRTRRAPQLLQDCGLEWFYRLILEPRRLWRRYLVQIPGAVLAVLRECLRTPR